MNNLKHIENFLFDMDGTLYLGNRLFEGVPQLFDTLYKKNKNFLLLTNNSSKDKSLYQKKWQGYGIDMPLSKIVTSGEATFQYLKTATPVKSVFILGTDSLIKEALENGFLIDENNPDAVVLGYDTTLRYENLVKACLLLQKNKLYFATHPDINCPSEAGPLPDCGAMIEMIYASTGKRPKILGKPNKEMVDVALLRVQGKSSNTAIVGDRLYTDIEMGYRANLTTILVLTGEAKREDLKKENRLPDFVMENINGITELI